MLEIPRFSSFIFTFSDCFLFPRSTDEETSFLGFSSVDFIFRFVLLSSSQTFSFSVLSFSAPRFSRHFIPRGSQARAELSCRVRSDREKKKIGERSRPRSVALKVTAHGCGVRIGDRSRSSDL